jgi:hypothetical protein
MEPPLPKRRASAPGASSKSVVNANRKIVMMRFMPTPEENKRIARGARRYVRPRTVINLGAEYSRCKL